MRTPRYLEIAATLRTQIQHRAFPNDRLPSERELGQQFHVQRDTVRRALQVLEDEKYIRRDSRRGTFLTFLDTPQPSPSSTTSGNLILAVRHGEEATSAAQVLQGMTSAASEVNLPVLWMDTLSKSGSPEFGVPSLETLLARRAIGIALWPELPTDVTLLRTLRSALPLVLLDRRVPGFEADFIGFDDRAGGYSITTHLLSLGHRRIGFLSSEPLAQTVQSRLLGYRMALTDAGFAYRESDELHSLMRSLADDTLLRFLEGNGEPLTAVVCANDTVAARLIGRLTRLGRRVPDDLAVTGFGNAMSAYLDGLGLTTMAQPFHQLGQLATNHLITRGEELYASHVTVREIQLPMELIVRTSCGETRSQDSGLRAS